MQQQFPSSSSIVAHLDLPSNTLRFLKMAAPQDSLWTERSTDKPNKLSKCKESSRFQRLFQFCVSALAVQALTCLHLAFLNKDH
jgi:hypothetical protein